jgi:hypothetical protein
MVDSALYNNHEGHSALYNNKPMSTRDIARIKDNEDTIMTWDKQ